MDEVEVLPRNPAVAALGAGRQPTVNRDFLIQRCGSCGVDFTVDSGDVLCGGHWYHESCWTRRATSHGGG